MANEFYVRKGLIVSGSTTLSGSLQVQQGITGSLFGTASSATNAVSAPAGTLTGTTLASGVTASSLTSVGTLTSLAVTGDTILGAEVFRGSDNSYMRLAGGNPSATGANIIVFGSTHASAPGRVSVNADGTGEIQFSAGGAQRAVIDASGNLGLGTASPSARLHVNSGTTANAAYFVSTNTTAYSSSAYNGSSARLMLFQGSGTNAFTGIQFTNSSNMEGFFGCVQDSNGYGNFVFQTFNGSYAERARIDASGNFAVDTNTLFVDAVNNRVGIGTATPATQLHVSSSGGNTAEIRLQAADGREYSIGSTGTGYGSTNNLIFYDVTVGAERLRINSSGQVGIGTTTPGAPLHVQGAISGSTMTLTGTATVQTLVETSTQELKKNITAMESTVTTLSKLEPSRFNWISTDEPDIGLIAEQVEQIFPELVTHAADGKLIGVKYSKLTVLLLKAVQEMSQRIESLEQQSIYKHTH